MKGTAQLAILTSDLRDAGLCDWMDFVKVLVPPPTLVHSGVIFGGSMSQDFRAPLA